MARAAAVCTDTSLERRSWMRGGRRLSERAASWQARFSSTTARTELAAEACRQESSELSRGLSSARAEAAEMATWLEEES
jgi:hypothetical protein